MKYLILGNGPASIHAIESIRKKDHDGQITMITAEHLPAYSPCVLSDLLASRIDPEVARFIPDSFYERHRVEVIEGELVLKIEKKDRIVTTSADRSVPYDRLFIGIGAEPVIPPFPGSDLENVFCLKTRADVESIQNRLDQIEKVIVIGAGFIGLEAAQAFKELGKDVRVIEMANCVLPAMMSGEASDKVLDIVQEEGIKVLLGEQVTSINSGGSLKKSAKNLSGASRDHVTSVSVENAEYPCDLVVIAAGVKARIKIAKDAGLEVDRGILIDQNMRTSDPFIYAGGDVAEANDFFGEMCYLPTWPNATMAGRVAGANMAGGKEESFGIEALNVVTVCGRTVCSVGRLEATECLVVRKKGVTKSYLIEENRLVGFQWVGTAVGAGLALNLIRLNNPLGRTKDLLMEDRLNHGYFTQPKYLFSVN